MRPSWQALATWMMIGSACAPMASLGAQAAPDDTAEIEQYHGLIRAECTTKKIESAKELPKATAAPAMLVIPASGSDKGGPALGIKATVWEETPELVRNDSIAPKVDLAVRMEEHRNKWDSPLRPDQTAPATPVNQADHSPVPAPAPPAAQTGSAVPAAPLAQPMPTAQAPQQSSRYVIVKESHEEASLEALANVVGSIVTPIAALAGLWIVVRHLQRGSSPLVRVEHVGGVPYPGHEYAGRPVRDEANEPEQAAPVAPVAPTSTAQNFELGPTYEEDQAARQQQAMQQEQGVLQQLFEDNINLQKEISASAEGEAGTSDSQAQLELQLNA